jgi:hypothetical protein
MAEALNQKAVGKLIEGFGLNSVQYNAIISTAANSPYLADELNTFDLSDWSFARGAGGSGTFANPGQKVSSFDSLDQPH